jgi:hypothetical protein
MKKAIKTPAIITSLRSKVDGSLGLTVSTPELTPQEKAAFMELQGTNLQAIFEPSEEPSEELKIEKDIDVKSPSQRLRSVIYVVYKNTKTDETFSQFYEKMMDRIIEGVKKKFLD